MKKNKVMKIKFLESIILIIIFTITIISNTIYQSVTLQKQLNKKNNEKGFLKLHDNYNGLNNKMSINDFFKTPNSSEKMRKLYIKINNDINFKYYEVLNQDLQFIGNYNGNKTLVSGSKQMINQKLDGNFITPLKSLQLGEKASNYLDIKSKIKKGFYFSKEDFDLNSYNEVPVVLGDLYSNTYNIGDSFEAIYLGVIKLKCNVVGFFKKNSSFKIDQKYNLNDKIVMPALNMKSNLSLKNNKKDFEKILYSIKNTGYIPYNSENQYNNYTLIINKIINKINIDWTYSGKIKNPFEKTPINLSIKVAKFIKILSWIMSLILILIIYNLEKQLYSIYNFSQNKKQRVLSQTKKSIIMALQIFIIYICICFLTSFHLKHNAMYSTLIHVQKQTVLFLLIGFIIIIYTLNLYLNKKIKIDKQKGESI